MGEEEEQQEPTIDTWTLRTESKLYERTSPSSPNIFGPIPNIKVNINLNWFS